MASRQEQEAGPSGIAAEEMRRLLNLSTSDVEEDDPPVEPSLLYEEEMGDSEEDEICNDVLDRLERQHAFQTNLLQQSGAGGLDASAEGAFEFDLDNMSID